MTSNNHKAAEPTHMVLHFSLNWYADGLAVRYFDSYAAAMDYAQSFEITEGHEKDSMIIAELWATAEVGTNRRFQLKHLVEASDSREKKQKSAPLVSSRPVTLGTR